MTVLLIVFKILLILLCILLSVLILVLFIPFDYFLNGKINDGAEGKAEIRWLFGLIRIIIYKSEDKPEMKIIICGLNIYNKKFIKENNVKKNKNKKNESNSKRDIGMNLMIELFRYFKDILNIVKPKYFKISGVYGFEDPSLTGMLLGVISIIKGAVPSAQIYVNPDFEKENINIEAEIYGDIKVCVIGYRTLKLIIKKDVRQKLFKKSKAAETF
ncbi:membrane protein [Clostridium gelidum]|uniref:Membrane protein n=1 Tax=Clostridium gelidum TaxID=704125 RepID=A0ABN6IX51_9CLOT|nr:DUF2953 domain-containing protein [Clostridium gelidum]BCZ45286.1 membrane protein [Clostridium gelidum]